MTFEDKYRLSSHAVILNAQNQVLLLKATYGAKSWGLPGGCLDQGETIHQALLRECEEELGCEVTIEHLTGVYFHEAYQSHAFVFACQLTENQVITLSDEHSDFKYEDIDKLSKVQQIRIMDCINYDGKVASAAFKSS